jgi:hypothetical protein
MKTGAQFQQAGHSTPGRHGSLRGLYDTGYQLKSGALASTIGTDQTDHLATPHRETDIAQWPDSLGLPSVPEPKGAQEQLLKGPRAVPAKTELFGDMMKLYGWDHALILPNYHLTFPSK